LVDDDPSLALDAVGPSTPTVENRWFQHTRTGENAPEPRATIGEGRQYGSTSATNRVEVLPDQPLKVCPGFRDRAKDLTTTGFRFNIADPHLDVTFAILAAPYERGIHGESDRRRRDRRHVHGAVSECLARLQGVAAQSPGVDAGVDRKHVL
jgi:hypothetical protein